MNLQKEKWDKIKIGEICDIRNGSTPLRSKKEYWINGTISWFTIDDIREQGREITYTKQMITELAFQSTSLHLVPPETVLICCTASIGEYAITKIPLTTNQQFNGLVVRDRKRLEPLFLFHYSSTLKNILMRFSGKTTIDFIPISRVREIEIPLPPLDEQQRIVDLFQSIEQSIVHAEEQEKNLRKLCKSLVDAFVSDKPYFGNLLKNKKLKKVYYRDVAQKLMRRIDPIEYGIERIVAGENLESEDFKIRTWGTVGKDFLGPAFHVLFQAGDILYGSRRTYLRKVALADFEGVCANTTYVIRANEEIILQDLLKHIMLSERFTQYSISVSKGSTNPYINWKDLDNFVFEIPDLETQKVIANLLDEILDNAEKVREQKETLKKLKQKLLNEILG